MRTNNSQFADRQKHFRSDIVNRLLDTLTYLGYISYDNEWSEYENDAIKLQSDIEKLLFNLHHINK